MTSYHRNDDNDDDDDDNEPLSLGSDVLAALQSVLGGGGGDGGDVGGGLSLDELLHARRMGDSDDDYDDDDDDENENDGNNDDDGDDDPQAMRPGESHADYYKRLYPERYSVATTTTTTTTDGRVSTIDEETNNHGDSSSLLSLSIIEHPVAIVSMDDDYVQNLILKCFEKRPHWTVLTTPPISSSSSSSSSSSTPSSRRQDHDLSSDSQQPPPPSSSSSSPPSSPHITNYHFHWGEYEHIDWFGPAFSSGRVVVSCYYNRKGLIRKAHLAHILEKWFTKKSHLERFAPLSIVCQIPPDTKTSASSSSSVVSAAERLWNDAHQKISTTTTTPTTWILKSSITNQADGISLVRTRNDLLHALLSADPLQRACGDFVLQRYVHPPLLSDGGRKFHLRVFTVLIGNVTAFVCRDFLAIFSLERYDYDDWGNTRAHLTNIAHQSVENEEDERRCMRRFEEMVEDMMREGVVSSAEEGGERLEGVRRRVYEIVASTVEAVGAELTFVPRDNCFEIFGWDFMLDEEWKVWLLEVNAEPDLSKAGERLQPVIDKLLVDTLGLVLGMDGRFGEEEGSGGEESSLVKVFERKGRSF